MILLYDAWKHRATSENEAKKILYCKIHIGQNIPPLTKMTRHYSSVNSFFSCYSRLIRRPSASFSAIFSEFLCLWWKCKWLMQGVKTSMGHWIYILHMRNEVNISQAQIFSVRKWRKKTVWTYFMYFVHPDKNQNPIDFRLFRFVLFCLCQIISCLLLTYMK